MILVADSGSTHTDWIILGKNKIKESFSTRGFNPYFTTSENLNNDLTSELPSEITASEISRVYFYGSGCSSSEMQELIRKGLLMTFINAKIEIKHDLLGAARALFMNKPGIAIILGTGASTCLYNGKEILNSIPSLGYVLGDEGGGDYLGKLFITEVLYNKLPEDILKSFFSTYHLTKDQIIQKIYKEPHPNQFLASFSKFIYKHKSDESIINLIKKSFNDLFEKHISQYKNYSEYKIKAVGSVAYYFQDHLQEIASDYNTKIDLILKKPIQQLAEYHMNLI